MALPHTMKCRLVEMIKRSLIYDVIYITLLIACIFLSRGQYNYLLKFSLPSFNTTIICFVIISMYLYLSNLRIGLYEGIFLMFFRYASVYPIVVFTLFYGTSLSPLVFSLLFYATTLFLLKIKFNKINLGWNKILSSRTMGVAMVGLMVSILAVIFINNGLPSLAALNLVNIYEVRSEYKSSAMIALLQSFTTFFVVPFLIFKLKSKISLLIPISLSLIIFLSSGGKFIMAMCFVFLSLKFILNNFSTKHLALIFIGPTLCAIFLLNSEFKFIAHYLYFRPFMIPAWVTFEYFELSNVIEFYYYNDHFLTGLFNERISLPETVGWQMYPESGSYVNAGAIGYSFINTGWFPLIEICFIVIVVKLFSHLGNNSLHLEDKHLVIALLVILGIYLGTTNILTALKTRMFLAALVAMYFSIKRKRYE